MYLTVGPNRVLRKEDIIAIFDLDSSTVSLHTRNFLKVAEQERRTVLLSYELPKSFIITRDGLVYFSPFNSNTIYK